MLPEFRNEPLTDLSVEANKNAFRVDLVFGAVIVTALLTLALFALVAVLERVALRWRPPGQAESAW